MSKKKKYTRIIGEKFDFDEMIDFIEPEQKYDNDNIPRDIPAEICLKHNQSGICFGKPTEYVINKYVGMPQGAEGNSVIIGGTGSSKTVSVAKPTLKTWKGAMCVTDIKGELSEHYKQLYLNDDNDEMRPFIIFDPTKSAGAAYDPLWWLIEDTEENLINNIMDIAYAIIPETNEYSDPFWTKSERGIFAAALLYYFGMGLSFSEILGIIAGQTTTELCNSLNQSTDIRIKILLGEISSMKPETVASIDRGLRNKIILFAVDPHISHAFRGVRESADCFTWDDLDEYNIFLRIPEERITQWSGAINLMYTQLIRYLERKNKKIS